MLSVICPVFDTEASLLSNAVASVLREAEAAAIPVELILVDDGSSRPDTLQRLAGLEASDARLRVLRPGRNAGPAMARNLGIQAARGDWIGFLDADDLWLPGGLAATHSLMGRLDVEWILGRHVLLLPSGPVPAPSLTEAMGARPACILQGEALTRGLIGNSWVHLGALLVRRELALRAGGFAEGLYYSEDVLFAIRLSRLTPLHVVDADLYAWRRAGGGLTGSPMRLTGRWLEIWRAAGADPLLRGFAREIRWARYGALKGLAKNNLLDGRRAAALGFALRAFLLDPREVRDLARFLALWPAGGRAHASHYSKAEPFITRGQP